MKKFAFFVEGQTEMYFIENLLTEYLQGKEIIFQKYRLRNNQILENRYTKDFEHSGLEYIVSIIDVGNDEKVFGAIAERTKDLVVKKNYDFVFGIRDLYPVKKSNYSALLQAFDRMAAFNDISSNCYPAIAIQEIEAWFLIDNEFMQRYNTRVDIETVRRSCAEKLENPETIENPAVFIDDIFKSHGSSYSKKKSECHGIVNSIDYTTIVVNADKCPAFKQFMDQVDARI